MAMTADMVLRRRSPSCFKVGCISLVALVLVLSLLINHIAKRHTTCSPDVTLRLVRVEDQEILKRWSDIPNDSWLFGKHSAIEKTRGNSHYFLPLIDTSKHLENSWPGVTFSGPAKVLASKRSDLKSLSGTVKMEFEGTKQSQGVELSYQSRIEGTVSIVYWSWLKYPWNPPSGFERHFDAPPEVCRRVVKLPQ